MCSRAFPCGGLLYESPVNVEMQKFGLPQRALQCLNGHYHWDGLPTEEPRPEQSLPGWCERHHQARPCPGCNTRATLSKNSVIANQARGCQWCRKPLVGCRWKFCSDGCATAHAEAQKLEHRPRCQWCRGEITGKRWRYCSDRCHIAADNAKRAALYAVERAQRKTEPRPPCLRCRAEVPLGRSKYCSDACYTATENAKKVARRAEVVAR